MSLRSILLLAVTIIMGRPQGSAAASADWQTILAQYAAAPSEHRRAMLALGAGDVSDLPPVARVAIADAELRSNHLHRADRLFDQLIQQDEEGPWAGIAAIGRGWVAARRGRLEDARDYFDAASAAAGDTGMLGDFMVGMIDAGNGDGDSAIERFSRIAESPDASGNLRVAATMAGGYARFWMGDDAGARESFDAVQEMAVDEPVTEDARFAAALSQWRSGDADGAADRLRSLADAPDQGARGESSRALAALHPRAIVQASARRYRSLPLRMPAEQLLPLLHANTRAVARVALRRLQAGSAAPRPITRASVQEIRHDDEPVPNAGKRSADRAVPPVGSPVRTSAGAAMVLTYVRLPLAMLAALLVVSLVRWSGKRQ